VRLNRQDAVLGLGLAYLAAQMAHTMANAKRWPFCPYDMFSFHIAERQSHRRIRLITNRGTVLGPVNPWGLMPLEFFRVDDIVKKALIGCQIPETRDAFCEAVLARLNDKRWKSWDEIRGGYHPPPNERISGLELYVVDVELAVHDLHDPLDVANARLVYRYDPAVLFRSVGPIEWKLRESR
jgi:hypothetical protein